MKRDIVSHVYAAKEDVQIADELVREYLPFIKSETAKFLKRFPVEGQNDELGIAMFAFHEAAMAYSRERSMRYLVMECGLSYAVVLDSKGRFYKVSNLGYEVGQTLEQVVLPNMSSGQVPLRKHFAR